MNGMLDKLTTPFEKPINLDYSCHIIRDADMTIDDWVAKHKDPNDPWDTCPTYEISALEVHGVRINEGKIEAYATPIEKDQGKTLENRKGWFEINEERVKELYQKL